MTMKWIDKNLEPPVEQSPIAKDWEGGDLYEGDEVIEFNNSFIYKDAGAALDYLLKNGKVVTL